MHKQFYVINETAGYWAMEIDIIILYKELKTRLYAAPRVCGVTDKIIDTWV